MKTKISIALAGNPNCGKTTLFNQLTGSNGYVGNWPGVTVEKLEAPLRGDGSVTITDLPGIYSLSPYSPEERVTRDYLVRDRPDAVIVLLDATNLERNLYLATQVLECGQPCVVGLNMVDVLEKGGDSVDAEALSRDLGCPVVPVSALKGIHLDSLMDKARAAAEGGQGPAAPSVFSDATEQAVAGAARLVCPSLPDGRSERFFAVKALEGDDEALASLALSQQTLEALDSLRAGYEARMDDDAESAVTCERYDWIEGVVSRCVTKAPDRLSPSERIDRVVTSRALGIPIFVAVMVLVYYLAVSTVGTAATDWVNDNLFGDGWFVSPAAAAAYEEAEDAYAAEDYASQVDAFVAAAEAKGVDTQGVAEALESHDDAALKAFADKAQDAGVVAEDVPLHDSDGNLLDTQGSAVRVNAQDEPQLAAGEALAYHEPVTAQRFLTAAEAEEPAQSDFGRFIPSIPDALGSWLDGLGASEAVRSLVVDGVIGGVGSVLGFVPQMAVLFLLLCFLEDCGYMSRVAFVMDRAFRRFGLSGKSFIPLLVSSGCGVPGLLATKTIESERDRRMTVMLTTMIPCGAKLPIIALLMGALMGGTEGWWIAPFFYFLGLAAVIVSAIMLKKTKPFAGEAAPFVMELPSYHLPAPKPYLLHVWERVSAFIKKAGTIIFAAAVGIWFLSNFGFASWEGGSGAFGFLPAMADAPAAVMDYSLLAVVGGAISWIFAPLGFGTWQAAASSLSALIAKENLVSTFGVLFGLGEVGENSTLLWATFREMFTVGGTFSLGAMIAFVAFNMLDAPCFAAIGTIRRQMNDRKWFWAAIGYQCGFAWVVALIINQLYGWLALGVFSGWTVLALVLLTAMIAQLARPMPKVGVDKDEPKGEPALQ